MTGYNIWDYRKKSTRIYQPYCFHKVDHNIWLPNINTNYRIPMKLIIIIKQTYFALMHLRVHPPGAVMHGLIHTLLKCGDLLYDIDNTISIYETSNKCNIIWRCEACGESNEIEHGYVQRNPYTNSINFNQLNATMCDPRSYLKQHIDSEEHQYWIKSYRLKDEQRVKYFRETNFNSFLNYINNTFKCYY
jgi:hypothetical protein